DPAVDIDVRKGIPRLRESWIADRNDTQQLPDITSHYGQSRSADPTLEHLRFERTAKPRTAKAGSNVSQMHYARQGIITPEMEFVAIRENQRRETYYRSNNALWQQHKGHNFGAYTHNGLIAPEFVR